MPQATPLGLSCLPGCSTVVPQTSGETYLLPDTQEVYGPGFSLPCGLEARVKCWTSLREVRILVPGEWLCGTFWSRHLPRTHFPISYHPDSLVT